MPVIAAYCLLLILLSLGVSPSHAQQLQKNAGQTMARREAKMEMSSPGNVNFKTYSKLQKSDLITRGSKPGKRYIKPKDTIHIPSKPLKRPNQ